MKHAIKKDTTMHQPQGIIEHDIPTSIRLNKFISESGYTSRRNADRLIEAGLVSINGTVARTGTQVFPGDCVSVEGKVIARASELVYIALNKPIGITSTTDEKDASNIVRFMKYPSTIFPIGRLDKDSFGLILLTNDGNLVNKILREEYGHDKEYIVSVNHSIKQNFIHAMASGVKIYNLVSNQYEVTKPCTVKKVNDKTFTITLNQGLNRQIRRMCKALGYKVVSLQRTRIMNIEIGTLKPGEWRYLTEAELIEMNQQLKHTKL